jgi:hypothetical protein
MIEVRSSDFSGTSLNMGAKAWMPLTVDMDEIREWHPDLDDDVYDDKLLWLSENLCFGDCGLMPAT